MLRVIFLLLWIAATCFAGRWTDWQDATLCIGSSCKYCSSGFRICKDGMKIQLRYCDNNDITSCAYDQDGTHIRTTACTAQPEEGCADMLTTTTTTTEKPTRECCCEIDNFYENPEPESETKLPRATFGGRRRRQADDSPDYLDCIKKEEDPNCCKEKTTPEPKPTCCCELEYVPDYSDCTKTEDDPNCCKPQIYDNYLQ